MAIIAQKIMGEKGRENTFQEGLRKVKISHLNGLGRVFVVGEIHIPTAFGGGCQPDP